MKPNSETGNAIAESANANGHYQPGHWFLNICGELSKLRMQQRRRELTHINSSQSAYAGDAMVDRR